jgi:hypothetical protein
VAICAAQSPGFTGLWKLNVSKSRWSGKQQPAAVTVEIDHSSPSLKYSGSVVDLQGDERYFEFAGTVDGKEYPAVRSSREGKVVLQRIGALVILTTFKADDGSFAEQTRMSLSPNGRSLTYDVRVTDRGQTTHWTEVYERQPR